MKKVKLVLLLVLLVGGSMWIGIIIGGMIFQPPTAPIESWSLPNMEVIYPFQPPQETLDEYLIAAYEDVKDMSEWLDIAYPGAKAIWEEHGGFSSKEEIGNFLNTRDFGYCRHRVAYAYWFLQALYPDKEIKAIVGYVYIPSLMIPEEGKTKIIFSEEGHLTTNHAWLMIDGEVFDPSLSSERVRYYHPYGYCYFKKKMEMRDGTPIITQITFARFDVYPKEIEKQYNYDKGIEKTPQEDIPPWWYQH